MNQVNDGGILIDLLLAADTAQGTLQVESISEATASNLLAAGQQRFQHVSILNHKQT